MVNQICKLNGDFANEIFIETPTNGIIVSMEQNFHV